MLLLDNDRRLRRANRAALCLLGLQLRSLDRSRLDQFLGPGSRQRLEVGWSALLEAGRGQGHLVLRSPLAHSIAAHYSLSARMLAGLHLLIMIPATDLQEARAGQLSGREREVLELIASGNDGDQVARRLGIAPETVRRHLSNGRSKLGATSRAHAVALALASGEIRWPSETDPAEAVSASDKSAR